MEINKPIIGHLAAFFTIFFWGITYISTKILLVSLTPIEIMFFRLVLAVITLTLASPPQLSRTGAERPTFHTEWKIMLAGLCGVTLYFMLQNIALSHTQASNVSVLISIAPLLIALISQLVLDVQLKNGFIIGFAAAITGVILITYNGTFILKLNPLGDALSILAALVWALYSVIIKVINTPQNKILPLTRKVFTYGLLFLLPVLPLFEFQLGLERLSELPILLNLLFLGVVASASCFATWNYAVQTLGPVTTSVYIYLGPVITVITSALVLDETITPLAVLGLVLVLTGMVLSEREKPAPMEN